MAGENAVARAASLRLGGMFMLCAIAVGLYSLANDETVAEAFISALRGGFFLPLILIIALIVGMIASDLIVSVVTTPLFIVMLVRNWKDRKAIAERFRAADKRLADRGADKIVVALRWLIGKDVQ